jgi:hypothetical protein
VKLGGLRLFDTRDGPHRARRSAFVDGTDWRPDLSSIFDRETLRKELPPGLVDLVLTNVGSPSSARAAMMSPNLAPTWASSAVPP